MVNDQGTREAKDTFRLNSYKKARPPLIHTATCFWGCLDAGVLLRGCEWMLDIPRSMLQPVLTSGCLLQVLGIFREFPNPITSVKDVKGIAGVGKGTIAKVWRTLICVCSATCTRLSRGAAVM